MRRAGRRIAPWIFDDMDRSAEYLCRGGEPLLSQISILVRFYKTRYVVRQKIYIHIGKRGEGVNGVLEASDEDRTQRARFGERIYEMML